MPGSMESWRYRPYMAFDTQFHKGTVDSYGGFFLCIKAGNALSVLSAMREANSHRITVKGGRFLEAVSEAHTIVFDKTGTLTKAEPVLADIVVFNDMSPK